MDLLPPEIKEQIFGFLDAASLQDIVPRVNQEWANISGPMLQDRVTKMRTFFVSHPHYLEEIKKQLPPQEQDENEESGGRILCLYERAFLSRKFKIESWHLRNVTLDFLLRAHKSRGCDCRRQNLCIIRSLHLMHCHQLVLIQMPEKIQFYSMTCIQSDHDGTTSDAYTTSVLGSTSVTNVWIDNNTHTAVSVYNDKVVSQETTRALILFRVAEVNHKEKTIVLENIRRIFLPLWSCDLVILKDKVCSLFTTSSVGVWHMEENHIQVSGNTCVDVLTMRNIQISKMYTFNNLVLIKILTDESAHWSVFDANVTHDTFQLHQIDFTTLVSDSILRSEETCCKVIDVFLSTNCFIIHCQVLPPRKQTNIKRSKSPLSTSHKLLCRRIISQPSTESFTTADGFLKMLDKTSELVEVDTDSSEHFTAAFFPLFCANEPAKVLRFIGVNDFPVYCKPRTTNGDPIAGKFSLFHALLYSVINV